MGLLGSRESTVDASRRWRTAPCKCGRSSAASVSTCATSSAATAQPSNSGTAAATAINSGRCPITARSDEVVSVSDGKCLDVPGAEHGQRRAAAAVGLLGRRQSALLARADPARPAAAAEPVDAHRGATSSTGAAGTRRRRQQVELRRRRRRLGQRRARVLHRPHRQRRPRRQRQSGDHRARRSATAAAATPRRASTPAASSPGLRPLRSAHPDARGAGHLAGVLDARRQHRHRRLAELRRDRHHGEHRLASRRSNHGSVHGPGYSGGNALTGHVLAAVGAASPTAFTSTPSSGSRTWSAGTSTTCSTRRARRPTCRRARPGSTTTRSSSS